MHPYPATNNQPQGSNTYMNNIFGPLPKQYCLYFYILTVLAFILLMFLLFGFLYVIITNKVKRNDTNFIFLFVTSFITYLLMYFTYRMFYSMCINSLH